MIINEVIIKSVCVYFKVIMVQKDKANDYTRSI